MLRAIRREQEDTARALQRRSNRRTNLIELLSTAAVIVPCLLVAYSAISGKRKLSLVKRMVVCFTLSSDSAFLSCIAETKLQVPCSASKSFLAPGSGGLSASDTPAAMIISHCAIAKNRHIPPAVVMPPISAGKLESSSAWSCASEPVWSLPHGRVCNSFVLGHSCFVISHHARTGTLAVRSSLPQLTHAPFTARKIAFQMQ
jgi:hypothetical protein